MKIVYNPSDGAPISGFRFNGTLFDTHYPDGYEMPNRKLSNGLKQYDDATAEQILETYAFLRVPSTKEYTEIVNRKEEEKYKCDFPGCEFETQTRIALAGHKKTHAKDEKAVIDPGIIPIAGGKKIETNVSLDKASQNEDNETKNGIDRDGVDWYGDGVKKEDFGGIKPIGKGHFGG